MCSAASPEAGATRVWLGSDRRRRCLCRIVHPVDRLESATGVVLPRTCICSWQIVIGLARSEGPEPAHPGRKPFTSAAARPLRRGASWSTAPWVATDSRSSRRWRPRLCPASACILRGHRGAALVPRWCGAATGSRRSGSLRHRPAVRRLERAGHRLRILPEAYADEGATPARPSSSLRPPRPGPVTAPTAAPSRHR